MAGQNGITWFPMDTDVITDDEKVFDLMEDIAEAEGGDRSAAWVAFGRWTALLCRIYREGPALQLDQRSERKLARDLDMTRDELLAFIGRCVGSGLLDRGMWETCHVLTSRGIQRRWCVAKKKTKAGATLPPEMSEWSLLEAGDSRTVSGNLGQSREISDESGTEREISDESGKTREISDSCPKKSVDKIREEEIREDEIREDEEELFSSSVSGIEGVPPCMAAARDDGTWFPDDADGVYPTIGEALQARYAHRTGLSDFPEFIAKVSKHCPSGCRGDPQRAGQCHALIARALDRYDPSYGSGPLPLTLRIIDMDRGF